MKTTEIAAYILANDVRLYVGSSRPMQLQPPVATIARNATAVGWVAFQLVAILEAAFQEAEAPTPLLWFNPKLKAFGFFISDWRDRGWELVEFDGYGELESWKEVGVPGVPVDQWNRDGDVKADKLTGGAA